MGGGRYRGRRPRLLLGPPLRRRGGGTGRHAARGGPRLLDGVAARHDRRCGRSGAGDPGIGARGGPGTASAPGRDGRPTPLPYSSPRRASAARRRDQRRVRRHHRRRAHPQRAAARPGSASSPGRAREVGARGGRHAAAGHGAAVVNSSVRTDRCRGVGGLRPRTRHLQPRVRGAVRYADRAGRPRRSLRPVRARLLVAAQAVDHRDTRTVPGTGRPVGAVRTAVTDAEPGSSRRAGTAALRC